MADVPGTWLDERVQPKPEPEAVMERSGPAGYRKCVCGHFLMQHLVMLPVCGVYSCPCTRFAEKAPTDA